MAIISTSGCASEVSQAAICDGSEKLRTDHAAALVEDGGPKSKASGVALIGTIDAGCN